jgi:hypothetical protein
MDRIQKLNLGHSIMEIRCCRASYGMVCMELYDKLKHIGLETWTDPLDQKVYVKEQIDWFVKKVRVSSFIFLSGGGEGRWMDREGITTLLTRSHRATLSARTAQSNTISPAK